MKLTKDQIKKTDDFINEIGRYPQFSGLGAFSKDEVKQEMYQRAYANWFRGGRGWGPIQQGGTGQMRLIIWYQNIFKPKSKEWRPKIIIEAALTQICA